MSKPKYESELSFYIKLKSETDDPTGKEILTALKEALKKLDEDSIYDAIELQNMVKICN